MSYGKLRGALAVVMVLGFSAWGCSDKPAAKVDGAGKMESGKMESGKMEPGKMEPGKMEPGKMEPGKM